MVFDLSIGLDQQNSGRGKWEKKGNWVKGLLLPLDFVFKFRLDISRYD